MTLRLKLMAGLVALCALGLATASAASVFALRSYLNDRVDQQLTRHELIGGMPLASLIAGAGALRPGRLERAAGPTDYVVEVRRADGRMLRVTGSASVAPPTTWLLDAAASAGQGRAGMSSLSLPFTVTAGGDRYRAVQRTLPEGSRVLVALPLRPITETVRRLVRVEAAVGAAVLVIMAVLAWFWLSRGLRPLRQMIGTASAIAAGDLDRRVPAGPARSETGQLAAALNAMLGQIQTAFADRIASQEQERRFAADAAHELRTPLTSIRGYADLLRSGMAPPADADTALRRIQEEAVRMGTLVDDLLYLAHLDELAHPREPHPLEPHPLERSAPRRTPSSPPRTVLDLADVVRDAVADLRAAAPERPVHADLPATCPVLGDAGALRQLVGNLLTNARVHTPPDTPVEIRLRPIPPTATVVVDAAAAPSGLGAVLDVVDRGPGLPPEVAEHVFDRFYRAPESRASGRGGSGLGLSIVAATARAHGGLVEVTSIVGTGTAFRVLLPGPGAAFGS